MKVAELTGPELDYWVAKAEGTEAIIRHEYDMAFIFVNKKSGHPQYLSYSPSTDWSQGGPIIEREKITLGPIHDITKGFVKWTAKAVLYKYPMSGPTALIAAMRFYVALKFGEEVLDE